MSGGDAPIRIVVMGVAGSGKSEVASRLAERLGARFVEADEYHSPENRAKLTVGIALTDDDRWPWLDEVAAAIAGQERVVATCSALRRAYRDRLRASAPGLIFVELDAPRDVLAQRLATRTDHFMASSLLDSQLATLDPLQLDEAGFRLEVIDGVEPLATRVLELLDHASGSGV